MSIKPPNIQFNMINFLAVHFKSCYKSMNLHWIENLIVILWQKRSWVGQQWGKVEKNVEKGNLSFYWFKSNVACICVLVTIFLNFATISSPVPAKIHTAKLMQNDASWCIKILAFGRGLSGITNQRAGPPISIHVTEGSDFDWGSGYLH